MRKIIIVAAAVAVLAVVVDRNLFQPYRDLQHERAVTSRPAGRAAPGYLTVDELQRKLNAEERATTRPATLPVDW
jgi:hypothetical protein